MAVFSIERCNKADEQIILDVANRVLRVYGRQSSISAPLHTAVLQLVKRGGPGFLNSAIVDTLLP